MRDIYLVRQRLKEGAVTDDVRSTYPAVKRCHGWSMIAQKIIWDTSPPDRKHIPLGELLKTYKVQESSNVRDRVYGLLSLAGENPVKVDDNISLEHLYSNVLHAISKDPDFRRSHNFSAIDHVLQRMLDLNRHQSKSPVRRCIDLVTKSERSASRASRRGLQEEAEEIGVKILHLRKEVLGEKHVDTIQSIANIALIYHRQGRSKEAEEISIKVLELQREALGEKYPNVL